MASVNRYLVLIVTMMLCCQNLLSQTIIQGKLTDNEGKSCESINVLFYNTGTNTLISYAISDKNGTFKTTFNSQKVSLDLVVSSVQYRVIRKSIENTSQTIDLVLEPDVKQLDTYTVKGAPIVKRGDTISYLVNSFAGKEDRAIEDVLRRMPGIDVEPDGSILYQGKPLQKFYVEGLDLMNGRYSVVSKNLPYGSVSTVEILENHQPIRVLEDKVSSNQASLNLKLKSNLTSTGIAQVGSGLTPLLWSANFTPMIFTKDIQLLGSYQTNNIGKDVAKQLQVLTFAGSQYDNERPSEFPELLNVREATPPELEQQKYLNNSIHLVNLNGLVRLKHDVRLRANLYYINDNQHQSSALQHSIYSVADTLSVLENFNNQNELRQLLGEFTITRNSKKNYLNNVLKIQKHWDEVSGLIEQRESGISQQMRSPFQTISNELQSIFPIGKQLLELRSSMLYSHSPLNLTVTPGQFIGELNQTEPYQSINQILEFDRFYFNSSAGFVFTWKKISFTPRAGILFRKQFLESKILLLNNGQMIEADSVFRNQQMGQQSKLYCKTEVEFRKPRFSLKAIFPVSVQQVHLKEIFSNQKQEVMRFYFDPALYSGWKISPYWNLDFGWNLSHKLSNMDEINYGYLLRNYHVLNQNSAPLSVTTYNNFITNLSYRNPLTSFYHSINYGFTTNQGDMIYSYNIQADGFTMFQGLVFDNTSWSNFIQGYSSKYFSLVKTTISLRVGYNDFHGFSFLNTDLLQTRNVLYTFKPSVMINLNRWFNADYGMKASNIQNYINDKMKSSISLFRHNLNLFVFPSKTQMLSVSGEYYRYLGKRNVFVDLNYRFTFAKRKTDIEVRWNNIFNTKSYTVFQGNSYSLIEATYFLRPSQLFVKLSFGF